jgi:Leucine-rich repeat (LRR) protein
MLKCEKIVSNFLNKILSLLSKRFLSKLIFIFTFSLSQAVIFDCQFHFDIDWTFVGHVYTCEPKITHKISKLEVKGTHKEGKNNSHVEGLAIYAEPLVEIPEGIETFFPNLKGFVLFSTSISSISSDDLKFINLNFLQIYESRITTLEGNLFVNNRDLQFISFYSNQIEHVGHDLLTGLDNLKTVYFSNNPCINKDATTREAIEELNLQLPISCPPLPTCSQIINVMDEQEKRMEEIEKKLESCQCEL